MTGKVIHHNGKIVGEVQGSVFVTHRHPEHILGIKRAVCVSDTVIDRAEALGANSIEIVLHKGGVDLTCRLSFEQLKAAEPFTHLGDRQRVVRINRFSDDKQPDLSKWGM